jgi:tRNA(Arg) A34 adenosine deaminase TadA
MRRTRRALLAGLPAGAAAVLLPAAWTERALARDAAGRGFMEQAFALLRLAQSWGDQPFGAVIVLDGVVVGEGPSRVILRGDGDAHAEREAIRDARQRLGRDDLTGAVLYSTSRPCSRCERVAAEAHVARMIHGRDLNDAGVPRG